MQLLTHSIIIKELIPIAIATAIWGQMWAEMTVQVLCNNSAMMATINQNSSKDKDIMHIFVASLLLWPSSNF